MFEDAKMIFRYTRQQAIEDGVLVDLMLPQTASLVKEAGFKFPIAMTAGAYSAAVCPVGGQLPEGQNLTGRLWDVLMLLRFAIKKAGARADRVDFQVSAWNGKRSEEVRLWSHCGPGDSLEPVITILLEGED